MIPRLLSITLLVGALSLACSDEDPMLPRVGQTEQEIINGVISTGNFMKSVGALVVRQGLYQASFCTGTLIAQNLVLTAGHCLEKVTASNVSFYIGTQANGSIGASSYPAKDFIFHPKYNKNAPPPGTLTDYYDIALVRLAKGVPYSAAKMVRQKEVGTLLKLGDKVLLMGFGKTDPKVANSSGTKMQGFSLLKMIGTSEIWVDHSKWSQKCFGDSGGPTLMATTINGPKEWHVVGVASRTGQDCTGGSVETRVDVFLPWIHKYGSIPCGSGMSKDCGPVVPKKDTGAPVKKDTGVTTGKAMGALCNAGYECQTGLCIHSAGKNICSQFCDTAKNDCPGIWECRPLAGSTKGACIKPDQSTPQPDMGVPPPKVKLGDPCTYNSDCESDICGSLDGVKFCTKLCEPQKNECGDKMTCVPSGGGTNACIPGAPPVPETPDEGCSVGGGKAGSPALMLLVLLLLGWRRRK